MTNVSHYVGLTYCSNFGDHYIQTVVEQVGCYNKTLHARILGVANDTTHYFFTIDFDTEEITPIAFWSWYNMLLSKK